VLDATVLDSGGDQLFATIKQSSPGTRCLVLAGDVRQQKESEDAGADLVLLEGIPAATLAAAIEALLADQEG
jgi:DNA-binding NarL/FixJ family response regulator